MFDEADLESAVTGGVLTPEAAAAFRRHAESRRVAPIVDEEQFRLLTGFNDIFVTIALMLFLTPFMVGSYVGSAISALLAWFLAEYFTRKRRMALPSIVLLLAFAFGCFKAVGQFIDGNQFLSLGPMRGGNIAVAAAVAALATYAHWLRFKVPITVAVGAGAVVATIMLMLRGALALPDQVWLVLLAIFGVTVFVLAMWWDISDRERTTRRADVAFWLHLLAAPLIAHPVFALLGAFDGTLPLARNGIVIGLYAMFAAISLSVDRRALLVSGLAYFFYAVTTMFGGWSGAGGVLLTAIIIGGGLLLLSAFWAPTRAFVVIYLPESLRNRLPPVSRSSEATPQPAS